ncbi:MAG TPA: DUF1080 domain-containing protein [Gemmataceae bacterium]|nr:DUF1080 domain-containing protein [Gemmataceae bacterium]
MRLLSALALTLFVVAAVPAADDKTWDISDLTVAKPEDKEDVKGTPPPKGAIVLFDGSGLDNWTKTDGKKAAEWKLVDGGAMQVNGTGNVSTKEKFDGSFKLHVEFRVPYMKEAKGQARGNSGVYVQGRYEVQVLDSYGLDSKDNDCGAIYEVSKPLVNACKAPTIWQSYDIEFTAPKCEDGKITEPAHMTVYQNGVKIQDDVRLARKDKEGKEEIVTNTRAGLGGDPCKPGPIMLQDHGNPVQFRNVWLVPAK